MWRSSSFSTFFIDSMKEYSTKKKNVFIKTIERTTRKGRGIYRWMLFHSLSCKANCFRRDRVKPFLLQQCAKSISFSAIFKFHFWSTFAQMGKSDWVFHWMHFVHAKMNSHKKQLKNHFGSVQSFLEWQRQKLLNKLRTAHKKYDKLNSFVLFFSLENSPRFSFTKAQTGFSFVYQKQLGQQ